MSIPPPQIGNDWDDVLKQIFQSPKVQSTLEQVMTLYHSGQEIYPPEKDLFNALRYSSYADTKVVILGQDPYINPGQAHGFAFSVPPGIPIPPSLMNVYRELHTDLNCKIPNNGCLVPWAKQGVLLLNSILTVERGKSKSHDMLGWEFLTDFIIWILNKKQTGIVFMLWGNSAKQKSALIDSQTHLVLKAAHPSPLAGGAFFGCKHFSKANEFLYELYPSTIDWQIPDIR